MNPISRRSSLTAAARNIALHATAWRCAMLKPEEQPDRRPSAAAFAE